MSTAKSATLAERTHDLTRTVILQAAVDLLETSSGPVTDLTFLAVAKRANISQRTVFRYFRTREAFLDAVADEARARMALPLPPRTREELLDAPRQLYAAFEAKAKLVVAGLHTELAERMREHQGRARWIAIKRLVDELAPRRSEKVRAITAANIRYYLAAATWNYYRFYLGFDAEDTVVCAETAIEQFLAGLGIGG